MGPHYVSKEGLGRLEKELEYLKNEKMPEIVERIARAKELGDLSENAEYQDAKDEQAFTAGRIAELEEMIRKSEIIEANHGGDTVSLGSTIRVKCDGREIEYTITGSNEANPANGMISNESPLGKAFLGCKVGEAVSVKVPKGQMECQIMAIK